MKEGYIPQDQRKTILLLSDDIRTHSGVGCQSRNIVLNTAHRYNWVNLGGAVKHPDTGKGFDLSKDVNIETGLQDSNVKVIATEGYGNESLLRQIIKTEKFNLRSSSETVSDCILGKIKVRIFVLLKSKDLGGPEKILITPISYFLVV